MLLKQTFINKKIGRQRPYTCGVSGISVAGICPAACIFLYCMGVMCSKPGGGTSQYREGFRRLLARFLSADLDLRR